MIERIKERVAANNISCGSVAGMSQRQVQWIITAVRLFYHSTQPQVFLYTANKKVQQRSPEYRIKWSNIATSFSQRKAALFSRSKYKVQLRFFNICHINP